MPTNEERRNVAARLRAIELDLETEIALEIELERLYNALERKLGQRNCGLNQYKYLADLIEQDRTCHIFPSIKSDDKFLVLDFKCSECGDVLYRFTGFADEAEDIKSKNKKCPLAYNYCPNCGAKVVE